MAIAVEKTRKAETGSQILLGRRNREPASQSPKIHAFHALGVPWTGDPPHCGCALYIVHCEACKKISIVEKPALKSSSPMCRVSLPFCHLYFITSYQSYFCLWGVSRKITYCTESGVLNLCKGKECVMAKIIYCMASPLRVSLLLEV